MWYSWFSWSEATQRLFCLCYETKDEEAEAENDKDDKGEDEEEEDAMRRIAKKAVPAVQEKTLQLHALKMEEVLALPVRPDKMEDEGEDGQEGMNEENEESAE